MPKRPSVIIDVPHPATCSHERRVQWTATEFGCLVCKKAFHATADGVIAEDVPPSRAETILATEPIIALGLSNNALRVLRKAHLVTIQDVLHRRDGLLRIRNMGRTLATEIEHGLAIWEAHQARRQT